MKTFIAWSYQAAPRVWHSYLCPLPLWERAALNDPNTRMGEGSRLHGETGPLTHSLRREAAAALSHRGRGHNSVRLAVRPLLPRRSDLRRRIDDGVEIARVFH